LNAKRVLAITAKVLLAARLLPGCRKLALRDDDTPEVSYSPLGCADFIKPDKTCQLLSAPPQKGGKGRML
jgi:hypothetical protein